jgi:preprotein translocase subunit SecA
MLNIEKIKQECIDIDMQNIEDGDKSIDDLNLFYSSITLKELLTIYSEYNGLKCYKDDEPKEYRESYNLDILSILELL